MRNRRHGESCIRQVARSNPTTVHIRPFCRADVYRYRSTVIVYVLGWTSLLDWYLLVYSSGLPPSCLRFSSRPQHHYPTPGLVGTKYSGQREFSRSEQSTEPASGRSSPISRGVYTQIEMRPNFTDQARIFPPAISRNNYKCLQNQQGSPTNANYVSIGQVLVWAQAPKRNPR